MSYPIIRPATRADITAFSAQCDKPSIRALCMDIEDRIVALGGIYWNKGRWMAFVDLTEESKRYKMHILRSARRFFDEVRRDGIRFIYACADPAKPNAVRWMTSLGFTLDPRSQSLYRWRS